MELQQSTVANRYDIPHPLFWRVLAASPMLLDRRDRFPKVVQVRLMKAIDQDLPSASLYNTQVLPVVFIRSGF
jgi:hypothetical protein